MAAPAIAQYGGRYLVRRAVPEVAEGDWAPPHPEGQQIIVVEFPSMEQLHKWYHSPEYAKALAVRKTAVNRRLLFVQGVAKPETASAERHRAQAVPGDTTQSAIPAAPPPPPLPPSPPAP